MRLWTIQPVEVWDILHTTGVFRCDPKKADFINDDTISFRESYEWLVAYMKLRIGEPPDGVAYPIWAWHTRDWKHKKPDLRHRGFNEPGTECVCIEFEINDDQVLLSDFDGWHFVLGNCYYDQSGSKEESDRLDKWLDSISIEAREQEIKKSWEQIFNITPVISDWCSVGEYIQATLWELRIEEVKRVQFFRAR